MRHESCLPLRYHLLRVLPLHPPKVAKMPLRYDLTRIESKEALLNFLGIEEAIFDDVIAFDPIEISAPVDSATILTLGHHWFFKHKIPKKNASRGYREVWEATQPLPNIYKALARRLDGVFRNRIPDFPHHSSFGFVRGRSTRQNATRHLASRYLLRLDIKNFFQSIDRECIESLFETSGAHKEIASLLGAFTTIEGKLPLGLPTSPVISNAICAKMDRQLELLAESCQCSYSRYADDMAFSGNAEVPAANAIEGILSEHGFFVAHDKTRYTKIGQAHYVTGLSVSDSEAPHAPRSMKHSLRQELHYCSKFGLDEHLGHQGLLDHHSRQRHINRLDGLVKYVAHHEPKMATALYEKWHGILNSSGESVSFFPKNWNDKPFVLTFDETEFHWRGRNLLALGLTVSQNQASINTASESVLRKFLSDQYADGKYDAIRRTGLHYQDATQDLILAYVSVLAGLPFNGYVVFGELSSPDRYSDTYCKLLERILKRRLMSAESQHAFLAFEENSKVSLARIKKIVEGVLAELQRANNRRPETVSVEQVSKSSPIVGPPDFLLGVIRKYLTAGPEKEVPAREQLMFERLRDKYRVILDADTGIEYSRRNPLVP